MSEDQVFMFSSLIDLGTQTIQAVGKSSDCRLLQWTKGEEKQQQQLLFTRQDHLISR